MNIEQITLAAEKFSAQRRLTNDCLDSLSIQTFHDIVLNQIIVEASIRVYSRDESTTKVQYPASLWQHIKQVAFPKWLIEYFPVVLTTHEIIYKSLYPTIKYNGREHFVYPFLNKTCYNVTISPQLDENKPQSYKR